MNTAAKIGIGLGLAAIVTIVVVIAVKSSKKSKGDSADDLSKSADASDFNSLYAAFNKSGADIFEGASDMFKEQMKTLLIKNLSKGDVKKLIVIINKGEKNWTSDDTKMFTSLFNKWKKGFVASVGQR